eukprot:SAG31_NODE_44160_length_264_cov_0.618182_1_plen_43_part_10
MSLPFSELGVSEVKTFACDKLLEARVDLKLRGKKADSVLYVPR